MCISLYSAHLSKSFTVHLILIKLTGEQHPSDYVIYLLFNFNLWFVTKDTLLGS